MGLFGLFGSREEREQGALQKLAKRVTERYGPPENRQKALEQLADMGTPAALSTLCLRFTVRAEPGITDDEEKETARRYLVDAGEGAVAPIERFVSEQEGGSGLALSPGQTSVHSRQGVIEFASRAGRTTYRILLPLR